MIRRLVVTGASDRDRRCAAWILFRDLGADVIGIDKEPESNEDDHLTLDLSVPECGQTLLQHLGDHGVDVLVNNARGRVRAGGRPGGARLHPTR